MKHREISFHFVFHYESGTVTEQELGGIVARQERCHEYICELLRCKLEHPLHIFLYPDSRILAETLNETLFDPFFVRGSDQIHSVWSQSSHGLGCRSEVLLLARRFFSTVKCRFFLEGLSLYCERFWKGVPNIAWAKYLDQTGSSVPVERLIKNDIFFTTSRDISFPIAGSFIEYLFLTKGRERVLDFYRSFGAVDDLGEKFQEHFRVSLRYMEERYLTIIRAFSMHPQLVRCMGEEYASGKQSQE